MPEHGIRRPERSKIEAKLWNADFKNVQHLECGKPLSRRRELEDVIAVVVRRDRLDPFRLKFREILFRHDAAVTANLGDNGLGDRAVVERVTAVLLYQAKRRCETRIADHTIKVGRLIAFQE